MNVFRNAPRADFKVWGGRPKGSYEPEPSDRAQGSRLVGQMVEKNGKMVDRLGTTPEAVISYLGAYKLRSRLIRASDRDDTLDNATLDKPVIIKGEGSGVGAHFIVCFGPHRNLTASEDDDWDLVISDPDLNGVRRATPLRPRYDSSQFTYDTMVPLSATKRLFTSHFYVQLI
jgi:hypothetical protein